MANLSSLIHELRERIAASSSTQSNTADDTALEARFRAVLPNLVHAYVVPSSSANEREVIAVLKLISHTAKNFPGVFYHGRAKAVLPMVGRILPFLADLAFSEKQGVIFETLGSLVSLLRKGERNTYCQFFMDAMSLIEDLVYVGSFHDGQCIDGSKSDKVSLKCFCNSFTGISGDTESISDFLLCMEPADGSGVLIDLTDKQSWQLLAIWILKLIQKCLTEGTSYVQGLINTLFLNNVCTLFHFGDADVHMACFDFARIVSGIITNDVVPYEHLIRIISTILHEEEDELPHFRNMTYDSSLGGCLHVIHSSCSNEVVKLTAADLVSIFPRTMLRTKSHDLKVALCKVYSRIATLCPPHIWMPESLVQLLYHRESCSQLINCFQVALYILGPDLVGDQLDDYDVTGTSTSNFDQFSGVGKKRSIQDVETRKYKRRKKEDVSNDMGVVESVAHEDGGEKEYASRMGAALGKLIELLKPFGVNTGGLKPEVALEALSVLCIAFSKYPMTAMSCHIYQQLHEWLPWICNKVRQGTTVEFDLSLYLEAVNAVLISQSQLSVQDKLFQNLDDDLKIVLKLPWSGASAVDEDHPSWKSKCLSVQVFSKTGASKSEIDFEVWDLGILDDAEYVRMEAVMSMPLIVIWSGAGALMEVFKKLKYLRKDELENVKKTFPSALGYLSCLYGSCSTVCDVGSESKLFLSVDTQIPSASIMLRRFWCSRCDYSVHHDNKTHAVVFHPANLHVDEIVPECDFFHLQSIFFGLLYDDSSEEVQVSCVSVIQRILMHGPASIIQRTRCDWIKCIEFLLLHKKKAVREAFCSQISFFAEDSVLTLLFPDEEFDGKPKEQKLLDKIKCAFSTAEESLVLVSLMECTAAIMIAVHMPSPLFLCSLLLLVDQLDNASKMVQLTASNLIHRSCSFHNKGGIKRILSEVGHFQNELFNHLSFRLHRQPKLIKEFAEAVIGTDTEDLVKKMIPVVLPKLVVGHQVNDLALATLNGLAKCLNTDMVPLVVNWLPKVLAFALNQEDGRDLFSALQFYHAQTGSDSQEIFAAALPALLDEIICFLDDDSDKISQRLARVPQMIKEVARVLTGNEDLPNFLKNHFVGLLNSIDRKMLHSENMLLQKQALKRIGMLIEMMGCYLGTYVPKLMVLLMHAINKEALQGEGLTVLQFFNEQLAKVSPSSIKHVISQVFAALVPFLEREEDSPSIHLNKVVNILEELVFNNRSILKENIREFPPLPSISVLAEVNKILHEARGPLTFKDQLRDVVDGLNNENLNVRYMVACELRKLLKLRSDDATAMITGELDSEMGVLSSLITSLLGGCAEESRTALGQRLKLVCADCLGALGAVDPAKVKGFSSQRFKIECSDDDLIFELIHKHLARAFRSAPDTIVQDSAALAIQELLKIAGCEASLDENVAASTSQRPAEKDSNMISVSKSRITSESNEMNCRGRRLWGRFSNYVKEIIAPCLTSRFQLPNVSDFTHTGPIYRPSLSFRRWIFYWIKKLTILANGTRSQIFNSCRAIVRHDMQTATYLLPYLVLNAVCHGTENARRGIADEILTVLNVVAAEKAGTASTVGSGGQSEVCIQAVFTLLDNLGQWVDDVEKEIALSKPLQSNSKQHGSKPKDVGSDSIADTDPRLIQCKYVSELLAVIPKVTLARASFGCQAYARSLMYFESHVREKSGAFNPAAERSDIFDDDDVSFLMEIYSCMDEPDGISGLSCLRKTLSLQDQLLINKKAGNWEEVLISCEQALLMEPTSVQRHSDVLNCLLNMCHLQVMVSCVNGLITEVPQYEKTWCTQGLQAAWRLGRWDLMDKYLDGANKEGVLCSVSESNATFDIDVAKTLQAMMRKDQFSVAESLALSKQALIAPLAAAGMDSYSRAYPFVVKLHMLRELEDFHSLLPDNSFLNKSFQLDDPEFVKLVENLENRLRFTQPSLWAREPLLSFRRLVFGASGLHTHVGNCWLQYAKLCRMAGHYETAKWAISEAEASGAPDVHIEKAKLLWGTRRSDNAISELQQFLLNLPGEAVGSAIISSIASVPMASVNPLPLILDTQAVNENQNIAKTLLLYSRWIHYTGQKQKEDVISLYSRVRDLQPKWEKGYFYTAKYCDELLADARKRQEEHFDVVSKFTSSSIVSPTNSNTEKRWWVYVPDVLLFYAKGLHRGHKYLFQALPRLLTLWFEFGIIYQRSSSSNKDLKNVHSKVMSIMRGCLKDLPTYQWLTVLPQLVSRICHQNDEVVRLVKLIITSVLRQYPQQALWIMAAVSKSTVPSRREAAAEIIQAARKGSSQSSGGSNLFIQFASLVDHLIKLCFHSGQSKARTINILTEFSALKRMMPVDIIMPLQQFLTVNLPTCDSNLTGSNPFGIFSAADIPTISGISDEAEILSSLQRPKKVVLMGSDGIGRPFLCKPKDDLRKDARMMEFTAMINRLLSKYPESRRRKLYIRTFAVIPLTEDCGMVEWVPHTRGLRHILQDIYVTCGKFNRQKTNPHIKHIYEQCQGKMADDQMLTTKILPLFPPVFHKWFLNTFSEPAAWFRARLSYAHTTAVWSMVGHIVGLGDRHGENILFDSTTGDCVHVDFSCLFDKGLQLEKPELVPFRLTQNIIDGLGITGYEGAFLKVCEITLSVLRTHRETLMSILETFIHDPLVEWTKSHKSSGVEVQNPHAQRAISNIEARLRGVVVGVGAAPSLPLAVEGQVRRLIAEAVSHKNLGKMYIWWMPWF
uniref:Serine/threonine-protein kinase ATR n=1 Tax=Kalanchoe fedtschenkoi TaxID=63787 RepID=A0A7N0U878_KALFE